METQKELIGRNLIRLRTQRGVMQKEIAALAQISPAALSRMERGIDAPTLTTGERIAKALGTTYPTLLIDDGHAITLEQEHRRNARHYMAWHKLGSLSAQDQSLVRALVDRMLED